MSLAELVSRGTMAGGRTLTTDVATGLRGRRIEGVSHERRALTGYNDDARIPANRFSVFGYPDTMESRLGNRQEGQIVQSQLNLRDFLPGFASP